MPRTQRAFSRKKEKVKVNRKGKCNKLLKLILVAFRFFAKLFNKQGMGDRAYAKW